jgi:hypothetical protein
MRQVNYRVCCQVAWHRCMSDYGRSICGADRSPVASASARDPTKESGKTTVAPHVSDRRNRLSKHSRMSWEEAILPTHIVRMLTKPSVTHRVLRPSSFHDEAAVLTDIPLLVSLEQCLCSVNPLILGTYGYVGMPLAQFVVNHGENGES